MVRESGMRWAALLVALTLCSCAAFERHAPPVGSTTVLRASNRTCGSVEVVARRCLWSDVGEGCHKGPWSGAWLRMRGADSVNIEVTADEQGHGRFNCLPPGR